MSLIVRHALRSPSARAAVQGCWTFACLALNGSSHPCQVSGVTSVTETVRPSVFCRRLSKAVLRAPSSKIAVTCSTLHSYEVVVQTRRISGVKPKPRCMSAAVSFFRRNEEMSLRSFHVGPVGSKDPRRSVHQMSAQAPVCMSQLFNYKHCILIGEYNWKSKI